MRLEGERESGNVEDRRGMGGGRGPVMIGGGISTLVILAVVYFLGGDPMALLQQMQQQGGPPAAQGPAEGMDDEVAAFVRKVVASTEDVWAAQFQQLGKQYQQPKVELYTQDVRTGCGIGSAAMGPFYCPADQKVYLDPTFFQELATRFGAPGDFAQAYVIAHEIGHHVQNELGISDDIQARMANSSKEEANRLSVKLELQADFFAGVWAHHANKTRHILEPGDVEEGMKAAASVGDDRLQEQARGYVRPDSFTHGSSEQRVRWFRKGLETGDIEQGDTFNAPDL